MVAKRIGLRGRIRLPRPSRKKLKLPTTTSQQIKNIRKKRLAKLEKLSRNPKASPVERERARRLLAKFK